MLPKFDDDYLVPPRVRDIIARRWRFAVLATWLGLCALFLFNKQGGIDHFLLTDTDDNMRLLQVRDLLNGQGWFDLRQHRMDPALGGANIHWSRIVDLPIAGLMLLLRPILGLAEGDRWAVALAPLLPLSLMLTGLALTTRRLLGPAAYILAFIALSAGGALTGMFNPMRIDHHGWQLAMLAITMAGVVDPRPVRGGVTAAVATAVSLAIGLEMLIWLALLAAAPLLAFVEDPDTQGPRVRAFAATLVAALVPLFLAFTSYANRAPVCDALSPVWLADALLGAALLWGLVPLARRVGGGWPVRLALAAGAGAIVAVFHALAFPHCLQRLEGISPQATELWLNNVREARPITRHGWRTATLIAALPATGAIGYLVLVAARRHDREARRAALSLAVPGIAAFALLFWQTRAGPSSQLLGIPGAVAIIAVLVPLMLRSKNLVVQVGGPILLCCVGFGATASIVTTLAPAPTGKAARLAKAKARPDVARANRRCFDADTLHRLDAVPAGTMLTHVDLGPRLVAMTHHAALAGPYHRNDDTIVDIMLAFRGDAARAKETVDRHRADYVLLCPNMSETTIYMAKAPGGFYGQLMKGTVPAWLSPVALPTDSPFRLWKVVR